MMELKSSTIRINKTARYYMLGEPGPYVQDLWFVCHGYGQGAEEFLESFRSMHSLRRLVVAPEALNRFYLQGANGNVGASWMTRHDRENEIADYIGYLDALYLEIMKQLSAAGLSDGLRITLLGFSQGTATAVRWAVQGACPVQQLILWGGELAHDLDFKQAKEKLKKIELTIVYGDRDPIVRFSHLEKQLEVLASHHINYEVIRFRGSHVIDAATLADIVDSGSNQ